MRFSINGIVTDKIQLGRSHYDYRGGGGASGKYSTWSGPHVRRPLWIETVCLYGQRSRQEVERMKRTEIKHERAHVCVGIIYEGAVCAFGGLGGSTCSLFAGQLGGKSVLPSGPGEARRRAGPSPAEDRARRRTERGGVCTARPVGAGVGLAQIASAS